MKLSILIPVYNAERFIERCLNSLIIQDLDKNEYEIIIINDGSTDNSLEIVENYSKEHANVVFYSHENQGVVATRNKLLKHAKGTYIYFIPRIWSFKIKKPLSPGYLFHRYKY